MKTFIRQASLAHFFTQSRLQLCPRVVQRVVLEVTEPCNDQKTYPAGPEYSTRSNFILSFVTLGSSIWSCLGTYFTFLKFPQNIQNMEINKQFHGIFWLIFVTIVRSHRYQPVKTRMLLINNLTPKFMVTRNYFLAELS